MKLKDWNKRNSIQVLPPNNQLKILKQLLSIRRQLIFQQNQNQHKKQKFIQELNIKELHKERFHLKERKNLMTLDKNKKNEAFH